MAFWAAETSRSVRGALLVAPSDTEASSYPVGLSGWDPMPLAALPFPSIVVASSDDPFVTLERAAAFAEAWGSRFVLIGAAGHINSASSLGPLGIQAGSSSLTSCTNLAFEPERMCNHDRRFSSLH